MTPTGRNAAGSLHFPQSSASCPLLVVAQLFNTSGLPGGAVVAQRGSVGIGQGGSGWSDAGCRAACHGILAEELSYRRFVLCLRHQSSPDGWSIGALNTRHKLTRRYIKTHQKSPIRALLVVAGSCPW